MRTLLLLGTLLGLAVGPAGAGPERAKVRAGTVYLDGAAAWRGGAVTSPLAWSADGKAVAFTARDLRGRAALIVLLPEGGPAVLSWPIPHSALPARAVTWLGPTRLGAGPSELDPRVVASFTVGR